MVKMTSNINYEESAEIIERIQFITEAYKLAGERAPPYVLLVDMTLGELESIPIPPIGRAQYDLLEQQAKEYAEQFKWFARESDQELFYSDDEIAVNLKKKKTYFDELKVDDSLEFLD